MAARRADVAAVPGHAAEARENIRRRPALYVTLGRRVNMYRLLILVFGVYACSTAVIFIKLPARRRCHMAWCRHPAGSPDSLHPSLLASAPQFLFDFHGVMPNSVAAFPYTAKVEKEQ